MITILSYAFFLFSLVNFCFVLSRIRSAGVEQEADHIGGEVVLQVVAIDAVDGRIVDDCHTDLRLHNTLRLQRECGHPSQFVLREDDGGLLIRDENLVGSGHPGLSKEWFRQRTDSVGETAVAR